MKLRSLTLAFALASAKAAAEPTFWDRAREPQVAKEQRALDGAERLLLGGAELFTARGAIALLELVSRSAPVDARVDYLLAELYAVLAEAPQDRAELIVRHAARALARAPRAPEAATAWYRLALAAASDGERAAEIERYSRVLELTWDPDLRSNVLLNRAEAFVAVGDLLAARLDYRASLRLARRPEVQGLVLLGLAVALERSDDLPAAYAELDRLAALGLPRSPLLLPSVFFVPPYEFHYYAGLEALGDARRAIAPAARRSALERAQRAWAHYVPAARADRHRWAEHGARLAALTARKLSALVSSKGRPG
jgi:tetratricopeptide (TPR) repeat protein